MTKKEKELMITHIITDVVVAEYKHQNNELSSEALLYLYNRHKAFVNMFLDTKELREFYAHPIVEKVYQMQ